MRSASKTASENKPKGKSSNSLNSSKSKDMRGAGIFEGVQCCRVDLSSLFVGWTSSNYVLHAGHTSCCHCHRSRRHIAIKSARDVAASSINRKNLCASSAAMAHVHTPIFDVALRV